MKDPRKHVHIFDYTTFEGFTDKQIQRFINAKRKKKQKAKVRKKVKR